MDKKFWLLMLTVAILTVASSNAEIPSEAPRNSNSQEKERDRLSKLLPVFQIVRFPNDPCQGGSNNGTCYTGEECANRGGTNGGSCASGFGVCCVFTYGCGTTSTENCTYFTNTSPVAGGCSHIVCPCNANICSIRLDFSTFVITGPSTVSTNVIRTLFGREVDDNAAASTNGLPRSQAGSCLTDTFTVSNQYHLPLICGTMTGEHVYFDSTASCNSLDFNIGAQLYGVTAAATRTWNIKITQVSCTDANRPPSGCDQYHFGSTLGTIESFNFGTGSNRHLANQHQTICIRRETGFCTICFSADAATDTSYAGGAATGGSNKGEICCGYGTKGTATAEFGYDCLMIPGATNAAGNSPFAQSQCANNVGLVSKATVTKAATTKGGIITVCSKSMPFRLDFYTDNYEKVGSTESANANQEGFKLRYFQTTTNC